MRSKYGARRVEDPDYGSFDSRAEFRRWQDLVLLERAGEISELRRQVPFDIVVNGVKVCRYDADAVYVRDGQTVVEDVKSKPTRTPVYRLKKKLLKAVLGIEIREVE